MFMRYLWLSLFVESHGRIPLFIELRNLNTVSQFDIEAYLFHSLTRGKSTLSVGQFKKGLAEGEFIVILDGFDEVSHQMRERVQRAIMNLVEDYDRITVVISSRPDERFASWTTFEVASVSPLERRDTVELINKAEFDEDYKSKFIKKIEDDSFYMQHRSFLSNPLLSSMMLLTFSQSYDIPDKTHQFYESAFDALYKRHDSYKPGGFKREFLSTNDEDVFKRTLSYFCLLSYYEQSFNFSATKLDKYIRQAIDLSGCGVGSSDYIKDLVSAVCLLIKEGNDYTFAHRSFQEYFAAYCISFVTSKNFSNIVEAFAKRSNDQVIIMIRDMNPEQLRDLYTVPVGQTFSDVLKRVASKSSTLSYFEASSARFVIRNHVGPKGRSPRADIFLSQSGPLADFSKLMIRLSKEPSFFEGQPSQGVKRDIADVAGIFSILKLGKNAVVEIGVSKGKLCFHHYAGTKTSERVKVHGEEEKLVEEAFLASRMYEYIGWQMKAAATYVHSEIEESSRSTNAMAELFGG